MIKNVDDIQKMGNANLDAMMSSFGAITKGTQTIATEIADYSRRAFENGTKTMENLFSAKSLDQAVEVYPRRRKAEAQPLPLPAQLSHPEARKDAGEFPVIAFGPNMMPSDGINELRADTHLVRRLANTTFKQVAHSQLATYLLHVDHPALVGETRIACDHE